jgi:hypothetical protein
MALTGSSPDAIKGVARAYATLGFEHAKTAVPEGKHVILLRNEADARSSPTIRSRSCRVSSA